MENSELTRKEMQSFSKLNLLIWFKFIDLVNKENGQISFENNNLSQNQSQDLQNINNIKVEENTNDKKYESMEKDKEKNISFLIKPISKSPSSSFKENQNKKTFKLDLSKPEIKKNKDFASFTSNFRNSPNSNFKKSPKITIVNEDNNYKNEKEEESFKKDEKEKSIDNQNNLDLTNKESVSRFYN